MPSDLPPGGPAQGPAGPRAQRPRRGRRPGGPETREAILTSARRIFAEAGYPAATLRMIAADAGVDVRLVSHYFGAKADLFGAAVQLPFDPAPTFALLAADGIDGLGERLARFVITMLSTPEGAQTMAGLMRAAASEQAAAEMVRALLIERVLLPITAELGVDHASLRASLIGSQFGGLVLARHILGMPALVEADIDTLVTMVGPVVQHYLTVPVS